MKFKPNTTYFSKNEKLLWLLSSFLITATFIVFDRSNYMTLISSLIGITSLILNAKGNPAGQVLMVIFSVLYGIISYSFDYYGEMITYLGMTAPMAVFALCTWLKNPYNGNKSEVSVNSISRGEAVFMFILTTQVTIFFYFILDFFGTANLLLSTLSVTTSFIAAYLTMRRSEYFALAYAANDIILIALWSLAAFSDTSYISVIICFITFFVNDMYGFYSWQRMKHKQKAPPHTLR